MAVQISKELATSCQSHQKDTLSGQLMKTKEIWKSTLWRLQYFPSSLSLCLFLPLLPSSLLKEKAFLTVFQSSQGSGEKHWLNTAHSVCRAAHGCSREKGLLGEGGGKGRKAAALEPRLRQGRLLSEPAVTKGIKQLLFPGESEGVKWRGETDRGGNTERVFETHLTHRKLFSPLTS